MIMSKVMFHRDPFFKEIQRAGSECRRDTDTTSIPVVESIFYLNDKSHTWEAPIRVFTGCGAFILLPIRGGWTYQHQDEQSKLLRHSVFGYVPGTIFSIDKEEDNSELLIIKLSPTALWQMHLNGLDEIKGFNPSDIIQPEVMDQIGMSLSSEEAHAHVYQEVEEAIVSGRELRRVSELVKHGLVHAENPKYRRVSALCEVVNSCRSTFDKSFLRETGMTIGRYLIKQRVGDVIKRLSSHQSSVQKLAVEMNYTDHSHMIKELKRQVDMTPTLIRNHTWLVLT